MFDHSLIWLGMTFLLMSTANGQLPPGSTQVPTGGPQVPPVQPGATTTQDPQGGGPAGPVAQGGQDFCSMNETEVNSTIRYSFMAGSHLYLINGSSDFFKMPIDSTQPSVESVSAKQLFPDFAVDQITSGLYFSGFNCEDASIDANANGTGPAGSGSGSGSGAGILPAAPGSDDCTKANDLFIVFGKRNKVEFKPYRVIGDKFEAIKDDKELPWNFKANAEDFSSFYPKFGHIDKFPVYYSGLFDNNEHKLYIFGTVSDSNAEPTLQYKQFTANGTFEKGKFTPITVNQTYWGSMIKKDKIYVMSKGTDGPTFHELSISNSDAKEEQSFPLKKFMGCDNDSPLQDKTVDPPVDPTVLTDSKSSPKTSPKPSNEKKSSWIIWLIIALILVAIVVAILCFFCICNKSEEKVEPKPEEGAPPGDAKPPSQSGELSKRSGSESGSSKSKPASSTGAPATGSTALAKPSGSGTGSSTGSGTGTGPKSTSKTGTDTDSKVLKQSSKSSVRSNLESGEPSTVRSKLSSKTPSKTPSKS